MTLFQALYLAGLTCWPQLCAKFFNDTEVASSGIAPVSTYFANNRPINGLFFRSDVYVTGQNYF